MAEKQTCPRRMYEMGPWEREENLDHWRKEPGGRACSFCGSMHPEDFMQAVTDGVLLDPTTKRYKVYVRPEGGRQLKFYFMHMSAEQQKAFIALLNERKVNIGVPGYFNPLPFFITYGPEES